jgi:hypothetical protein
VYQKHHESHIKSEKGNIVKSMKAPEKINQNSIMCKKSMYVSEIVYGVMLNHDKKHSMNICERTTEFPYMDLERMLPLLQIAYVERQMRNLMEKDSIRHKLIS